MKEAEEILNQLFNDDKDKLYSPYIFDTDYAGGSRKYIREDIVIKALEQLKSKLLKEE